MIQLALTFALASPCLAATQVEDRSPRPLDPVSITSSPRNPQLTLAINQAREVVRSTDAGVTFQATPLVLPSSSNTRLQFDAGGVAYIATPGSGSSLWVSATAGQSWVERAAPGTISTLRTSPHHALEVWCSTPLGEIFKSTDAGQTWSALGPDLQGPGAWISHDVGLPGTTLVGRVGYPIWFTADGGLTWTESQVNSGYSVPVSTFDRWYSVTHFVTHNGGFYDVQESSPTATTWTLFSYVSSLEIGYSSLVPDPWNPDRVMVRGVNQLWSLNIATGAWDTIVDVQNALQIHGLAFPQDRSDRVLISTQLGALEFFRGADAGRLTNGGASSDILPTRSIAVDPGDSQHLVAQSTSALLLESFDGGDRWEIAEEPFDWSIYGTGPLSQVEFDAAGRLLLRTGSPSSVVWRRTDSGWTSFSPPSATSSLSAFGTLVGSPDLVVVTTNPYPTPELTVSKDGGSTWTVQPIVLDHPNGTAYDGVNVTDIHVTPDQGQEPRIIVTGWGYGWTANNRGWFTAYTDDLGLTYTVVASDYRRMVLGASPRYPERIAIGFESERPTESSTDALTTLSLGQEPVSTGALAVGSITDGLLVRRDLQDLVFESRDWGDTWTPVNGLPVLDPYFPSITMRDNEGGYLVPSGAGLWEQVLAPDTSSSYCGPAVVNSTGAPAELAALGSDSIADDFTRLDTTQVPPGAAMLFLASTEAGFTPQAGGSTGHLCLGGPIGRYQGDIQFASLSGAGSLDLDVGALAQPTGSVPALAGTPWFFQVWFRDSVAGQATSNFTDGCRVDWVD